MSDTNDPAKFTLEIEADMLPVLAHALIIQRNTAMMSQYRQIEAYLESMIEKVKEAFPAVVSLFSYGDNENWSEIFLTVRDARESVEIVKVEPANSWQRDYRFRLVVDGRSHENMITSYDRRFALDSDEFRLLEQEVRRIAPLDVNVIVPEPEPVSGWRL